MGARERIAGMHWLRKCLRHLVRIRRKNLEHRVWRAGVLASYRQPPLPKCEASNDALLQTYMQQEHELDERRVQVEFLRREMAELKDRVHEAKAMGFLQLLGLN